MSYTGQHASALARVKRRGAAVTFTRAGATTPGYAVRAKGDPNTYLARSLIESQAPTLFFVPTTYGDTPQLGDVCTWGGVTLTTADVNPIAPDGTTLAARVVVSA